MNIYVKQLLESFTSDLDIDNILDNDIEVHDRTLFDIKLDELISLSVDNITEKDDYPHNNIQKCEALTKMGKYFCDLCNMNAYERKYTQYVFRIFFEENTIEIYKKSTVSNKINNAYSIQIEVNDTLKSIDTIRFTNSSPFIDENYGSICFMGFLPDILEKYSVSRIDIVARLNNPYLKKITFESELGYKHAQFTSDILDKMPDILLNSEKIFKVLNKTKVELNNLYFDTEKTCDKLVNIFFEMGLNPKKFAGYGTLNIDGENCYRIGIEKWRQHAIDYKIAWLPLKADNNDFSRFMFNDVGDMLKQKCGLSGQSCKRMSFSTVDKHLKAETDSKGKYLFIEMSFSTDGANGEYHGGSYKLKVYNYGLVEIVSGGSY